MLPELLFAVGSSMQDAISRDDFGILNGTSVCDKDPTTPSTSSSCNITNNNSSSSIAATQHNSLHETPTTTTTTPVHNNLTHHNGNSSKALQHHQQQLQHHQQQQQQLHHQTQLSHSHHLITGTDCTLEPIKLGRTPEHEHNGIIGIGGPSVAHAASVAIKVEEPDAIYGAWHTAGTVCADIGSNLLCHSDDPLISGAIDDNQNEFHPIHGNHHNHHPNHHQQLHHNHSLLHLLPAVPPSSSVPGALIKAEEALIQPHLSVQLPLHTQHQHLLSDIAVIDTTTLSSSVPLTSTSTNSTNRRSVSSSIQPQTLPYSPGTTSKRNTATASASSTTPRPRRKGQLKLRFHHQALPQEYLDHYEATQNSQQKRDTAKAAELAAAAASKTRSATTASATRQQQQQHQKQQPAQLQQQHHLSQQQPPQQQQQQHLSTIQTAANTPTVTATADDPQLAAARAHDSVRNWLQKIAEYQHDVVPTAVTTPQTVQPQQQVTTMAVKAEPTRKSTMHTTPSSVHTAQRILNYSDLPFMGEMTLDNSKPRRGRKPKKADICHLIYKNYGTILPGTPNKALLVGSGHNNGGTHLAVPMKTLAPIVNDDETLPIAAEIVEPAAVTISNLLEQRLLNEEQLANEPATNVRRTDEPLNLCLRDRSSEPFTILSSDEEAAADAIDDLDDDNEDDAMKVEPDDDDLTTDNTTIASTPRPQTAASTSDTDSLLAANMRMSLPNFQSALHNGDDNNDVTAATAASFIHPMALYYQKMASSTGPASMASSQIPHLQTSPSPTISSSTASMPLHYNEPIAKILIPKNISELLRQHQQQQQQQQQIQQNPTNATLISPSPSPSSSSRSTTFAAVPATTPPASNVATPTLPQKRKRSAIFIPPMPVESTTSSGGNGATGNPSHHATEVSICKFKFTGGAKPSLQEKKMLSVDAGGNFRYYSGTGDKSMRGYEFFPRESLLASGAAGGSSAGAFLSAAGERMAFQPVHVVQQQQQPLDLLAPPSFGLSHEMLQLPLPVDLPPSSPTTTQQQNHHQTHPHQQFSIADAAMLPSTSGFQPTQQLQAPIHHPQSTSAPVKMSSGPTARKSRRSLQREKLEKTFKEKGFLIQTQQLESAEGATYCKFRQLRKFTRYLFRSWKDYLPGELQQQQQQQQQQHQQTTMPTNGLANGDGAVGESVENGDRTRILMAAAAAASAAASDANSVGMQEMMLAEHQRSRQQQQQTAAAAVVGAIAEET